MFRLILIILLALCSKTFANENLLTVQQQIERLQREVSDLSKSVFSSSNNLNNSDESTISNLSAIDMRIYDLEKDVKNLNASFEDLIFQIDDLILKIDNFERKIILIDDSLRNINSNLAVKNAQEINNNNENDIQSKNDNISANSLGTLKITSDNETDTSNNSDVDVSADDSEENIDITPEDQFQIAFDNIREKKYNQAKSSFKNFIDENPDNQLSGSAHYWLGELYILEKKFRDAALIFAEGYQNHPTSIKAPDMLFKLSEALIEVDKIDDACRTMEKFLIDYPDHKLLSKTKKKLVENNCLVNE